jgi:HD-GYP domain-containing protein (c-di-GMP phosphodiesterase class II)
VRDKVKSCFIYLMNTIQAGKIYSESHPKFKEFSERLYAALDDVLDSRKELTLGIVKGELAWEDEIFFNLSQKLGPLVAFLTDSRIERITFQQGLTYEELHGFAVFLARTRRLDKVDEKEYFNLHGIRNIRAGRLRAMIKGEAEDEAADELTIKYDHSIQSVAHNLNQALNEEEIDYLDLRFNVLSLMEDFVGRHQDLLNLVAVKEKDVATFAHLLNVTLLTMFFASRLEFPKDEVLDLGVAALYHDVGKLGISLGILKKRTKLAEQEYIQIRDHPVLGARILDGYKDTLGPLPIIVAFEHHLRYDLTGYPKLAYPRKPHPASMMVAICDVYDALALKRSYKRDYPPDKIYEVMSLEKGKMFDPQLLDKFFRFIGIWPVGTIVALSDDRIAVVREVHPSDPHGPTVEILDPADGKEMIDLSKAKTVRVQEALNPHGKGKKYLALARGMAPSAFV